MHTPTRSFFATTLALAIALPAPCQDKKPAALKPGGPQFVAVRYPRDKAKTIAIVGGTSLTLDELVKHIDERHYPGFEQLLRKQPT